MPDVVGKAKMRTRIYATVIRTDGTQQYLGQISGSDRPLKARIKAWWLRRKLRPEERRRNG
jgi:hypothetical protein